MQSLRWKNWLVERDEEDISRPHFRALDGNESRSYDLDGYVGYPYP